MSSKVSGQRPVVNLPNLPASSAETVTDLLHQAGATEVQSDVLARFLTDAAGFAGDPQQLSAQEARVGVAMYLQQTGKPEEGARMMAAYAKPLGFDAEPKWTDGLCPAAQKLLDGVREADAEQAELAKAAASLTDVTPVTTNGYSTQMFTATGAGGVPLFMRATRPRTDIGHWEAERSQNMVNILAHQLAAPSFVMASVIVPKPASLNGVIERDNVMVLPRMGSAFKPAGHQTGVTNPNAAKITEDDRITGAVLSYLLRHNDARANNIQVDDGGHTIFIDHDNVLGRPAWFKVYGGPINDDFFKGQSLGYQTDLSTFDKLPDRVKTLIDGLVTMTPEQISSMYGSTEPEAAVLLEQAQRVKELGLEGAIAKFPVPVP